MLYLNILKVCVNKGIDDPKHWLLKNGFSRVATARLLDTRSQESFNYESLEKLCLLLYCTPNDLITWQPKADAAIPANHPMLKLKDARIGASISSKLKTMSLEKIATVQKLLDELAAE